MKRHLTPEEQERRHGLRPMFHPGERTRCPGCSHSQWHVGRFSAECAFCATTLMLAPERVAA